MKSPYTLILLAIIPFLLYSNITSNINPDSLQFLSESQFESEYEYSASNYNTNSKLDTIDPSILLNPITEFSTPISRYFLQFASYGYCTETEMTSNKCCPKSIISKGWTLLKTKSFTFADYNIAILKNTEYKKIVITFPGTRSKFQLLQEIQNSSGVPFKNNKKVKVLSYFHDVFSEICDYLKFSIKDIYSDSSNDIKDYQVIFTGHSLGGSMASIMAIDLIQENIIIKTKYSPVLISYGQPRTGNDIFSNQIMSSIPLVFRVIRQGDPISSFPGCESTFSSYNCRTVLPMNKFIENLILSDDEEKQAIDNFYNWHLGGLKLYDDEMEFYYDCGVLYGDKNPDPKCNIEFSFDWRHHSYYFGRRVAKYCRQEEY